MKRNTQVAVIWVLLLLFGITATTALSQDQKKDTKEPCVTSAQGPLMEGQAAAGNSTMFVPLARVGKKAPDFEAVAFQGDGFKKVKLSDYSGKWVVLCFYPGDFTFV